MAFLSSCIFSGIIMSVLPVAPGPSRQVLSPLHSLQFCVVLFVVAYDFSPWFSKEKCINFLPHSHFPSSILSQHFSIVGPRSLVILQPGLKNPPVLSEHCLLSNSYWKWYFFTWALDLFNRILPIQNAKKCSTIFPVIEWGKHLKIGTGWSNSMDLCKADR